jgi:hypothetical protein
MTTRKLAFIAVAVVPCFVCAYLAAYFMCVERVRILRKIEIVDTTYSTPPNPRALVEVRTEGYTAMYSSFSADFFWPAHCVDCRFVRPQIWAQKRTQTPVTPRS